MKGTTYVDWTARSLGRGMSGTVSPVTYTFAGTDGDAALLFTSRNNTLTVLLRLDARTGVLSSRSIPGSLGVVSGAAAPGRILLADYRRAGTATSASLRVFDLAASAVSAAEWALGTDQDQEYSTVRPAILGPDRKFWLVLGRSGDTRGDQVFRFDPVTNTKELMYEDTANGASTLSLLGPGPGDQMVAYRAGPSQGTIDLLVFDGTPGTAPRTVSVNQDSSSAVVRGFLAQGTYYLVLSRWGSSYSVMKADLTAGTLGSTGISFSLTKPIGTLEVRGDQVFVFAEADFDKIEGVRLDLTKAQTAAKYSLPFAQIHNP